MSVITLPLTPAPSDCPLLIADFYANYIVFRIMDGIGRGRLWESYKEVLYGRALKGGAPLSNFQ